jgi:circadian clock protein KaiB
LRFPAAASNSAPGRLKKACRNGLKGILMDNASKFKASNNTIVFRLFVAGDEPHSRTAIDNLGKFCRTHVHLPYEIQVVDVFESYQAALECSVYLTPALIMQLPTEKVTVFGNLSDTDELFRALRLGGEQ